MSKGNTVNVSAPIDAGGGVDIRVNRITPQGQDGPTLIEAGGIKQFYLNAGECLVVTRQADSEMSRHVPAPQPSIGDEEGV